MRNALKLRDGVDVIGTPGQTILVACDGFETPLAADGDANERQITVADASGLRIGDGVAIQDTENGGGFAVTSATLVAQSGPKTFTLSAPLYLDYQVALKASAKLAFPVVSGIGIKRVVLEGLTIDGNREKSEYLNGCRGGGIYLFESDDITIRNCVVQKYRGDGISFQVSGRVVVEDCLAEKNGGLGIHPGSGSQHPIVRRCRSIGNDSDGLYVCWRVKHGVFENNEIRDNRRVGISIGHKDTDNVFRDNAILNNSSAGVWFRKESEAMGAHRNVFENNRIVDNGSADKRAAAIVIEGPHHDLVFRGNTIGNSKPGGGDRPTVGILTNSQARNLSADEGQFLNVEKEIDSR
jgi:parallel beta-helix repeat protein